MVIQMELSKGKKILPDFEMAPNDCEGAGKSKSCKCRTTSDVKSICQMRFSNELNNLGIRVNHLEDRVGNVQITGDARNCLCA